MLILNRADINQKGPLGYTPLHLAIIYRLNYTIKLLLAQGAQVNIPDEDLAMPLHLSASYGLKDVCRLLLRNKADINAQDKR